MTKWEYYKKSDYNHGIITTEDTDENKIYKRLAEEFIAKKLDKCTWIKSIKREQKYTHIIVTVRYDHGGVSKYYLYK